MSEGNFSILMPKAAVDAVNAIMDFLNSRDICEPEKVNNADYFIINSDSIFEIDQREFISLCESIATEGIWVRVYEVDEYGTEIFWYIDSHTKWRIVTEQEQPNGQTVSAYKKWHAGLANIRYGAIEEHEISILEEKYGAFSEDGEAIDTSSESIKKTVCGTENYIGKGILVPHAGTYWDWFLPDHQCLAKNIAMSSKYYPDNDQITYRRSYIIGGDIGYVWSWKHNGNEIYLLFIFYGEQSYCQRLVVSPTPITIDEAICAAYFDGDFSEGFDEPETWVSEPETDEFLHLPTEQMEIEPFDFPSYINVFDGRIFSSYCAAFYKKKGTIYMARSINKRDIDGVIEVCDEEFESNVGHFLESFGLTLAKGFYCKPKVEFLDKTHIKKVKGIKFEDYKSEPIKLLGIWQEDFCKITILGGG